MFLGVDNLTEDFLFDETALILATIRSMLRSLGILSQLRCEATWTTSLNPPPLGEEFARTWNCCPPRKRMCHGKNMQTCHSRAFPSQSEVYINA